MSRILNRQRQLAEAGRLRLGLTVQSSNGRTRPTRSETWIFTSPDKTKADAARYDAEAKKVITQYNAFEPIKGLHINGAHTQGENIADIAGLSIAYDAYKLSLGGKEAPVIDGLTGDQRFFLRGIDQLLKFTEPLGNLFEIFIVVLLQAGR